EIHLNPHLIENGIECLESDLGEFIIQLDDDVPSHIVRPIIHKNRREIARTFQREGIAADYNDDPETITRRARVFLREKYMPADDAPPPIADPTIHKTPRESARTLQPEGIAADYNDDPETITRRARVFLREKYMRAEAVITGGNFISAESGRLVLVTNEGNSR